MGISDALELTKCAADGDKYAGLLWDTMIYQIAKCIGSMAVVLEGSVRRLFCWEVEWSTMKIWLRSLKGIANGLRR